MSRFQVVSTLSTIATFLLIGIGGFVRAAGAGLGCPDWPRCFGRWIPPTATSQWTSCIATGFVVNKADLPGADSTIRQLKDALADERAVWSVSSLRGEGLDPLCDWIEGKLHAPD